MSMIIAAAGDVHGEVNLIYDTISEWQSRTGLKVDLILQVGDIGLYANYEAIDTPTRRRIASNSNELALYSYLNNPLKYEKVIEKYRSKSPIDAKMLFIRGNHDDHRYLEKLIEENPDKDLIPINRFLFYQKDSKAISLNSPEGMGLVIAGLGRIDKESRPKSYSRNNNIAYTQEDLDKTMMLANINKNLDIFMTHMYPKAARYNGSDEIQALVELIKPQIYLFGHLHHPSEFMIGETRCYGLSRMKNEFEYNINHQGMIFFEKEGNKIKKIS